MEIFFSIFEKSTLDWIFDSKSTVEYISVDVKILKWVHVTYDDRKVEYIERKTNEDNLNPIF